MMMCNQCENEFDCLVEGHECENCSNVYCDECADIWFHDVKYKDESAHVCSLCVDDWEQNQKDAEEEEDQAFALEYRQKLKKEAELRNQKYEQMQELIRNARRSTRIIKLNNITLFHGSKIIHDKKVLKFYYNVILRNLSLYH